MRTFLNWKKVVERRYLRNTSKYERFYRPIIDKLAYRTFRIWSFGRKFLNFFFTNVKVEQGRAKHDWTKRTKRYYGITWKSQSNAHIAFGDISSVIPDDLFVLSKLTDTITIGYFTGDLVNGSKVLLEIILNSNKSWKVLIRGKTVNPGKIALDELYNLDSVFEIVRQMKYCRAVPEVVKSKDFISKVGDGNSSEVCFRFR
jgi:hypothetical protein